MNKKNNFGIIRWAGALMVIIGHMYVLLGQGTPVLLWNPIHSLGVATFFVIGGYLITHSWTKDANWVRYLVKRCFRIFPALIFCVLVTTLIIGPLVTTLPNIKDYFSNILTLTYLRNCLLQISYALPGVFENNIIPGTVNGSIWCLPVEFLMYLLIPIFLSIGNKIKENVRKSYYLIVAIGIVAFGWVWTNWFYDTHYIILGMDFSQVMQIMPYYFVGSVVAICGMEKYLNLQVAMLLLVLSSMFSLLPVKISGLLQYIIVPYIILAFALESKPIFEKINDLDISYGMFLFSFVIQQTLINFFLRKGVGLNIWILLLLTIVASVFAGMITEKFIERPFGKVREICIKKISK